MPQVFGHVGWRQIRAREGQGRSRAARGMLLSAQREATLVAPLMYLLVGLYALTFAALSILQQDSFQTHAFDLGNMDQAVWNTAQGRPFQFTNWEGGTSRLAAHVEPILLLIAPLYRLYSDPKALLILQSVVISVGAIPAFWLARDLLKNDFAAVTFGSAYLLAPALEIANLTDFHAVSLSSSFLLFAFLFVHKGWYLPFFVASVLAMSTKEQVPMAVFVMGLYIIFSQKRLKTGLFTCLLAAIWVAVAFLVVVPSYNPSGASPYLSRYDQLGKSPGEIFSSLLFDPAGAAALLAEPAKVDYVKSLLGPTLYLALLSPGTLAMALPDLAINLLSNFPDMYTGRAHYGSVIVPIVIISSIYGVSFVTGLLGRLSGALGYGSLYVLSALVLLSSLFSFHREVFLPLADYLPHVDPHHKLAHEFISNIPRDAAVSASTTLNPHVSQRERLYLFPDLRDAEYVFVDVTANPYPLDVASQWWRIQQMIQGGQWGVVAARDGYLLLRRGSGDGEIPGGFFTFAQADPKEVSRPSDVTFGDSLRLLGYSLSPGTVLHGRDPYATLTLYWQALRPISQNYLVAVYVVGGGQKVSTILYQPTTLWYPTSRWAPGEIVKVEVARVPLGSYPQGEVWLGVVAAGAPNEKGSRLRPQAESSKAPIALKDEDTLVLLTELKRG